ncbi:hypothetical protein [Candidatus Binatus sp.]|uniref:hypothetical protein n=2 Tax=Candidatus Binatus sp. TaxID=2811406 RepID=UPI003C405D56
MYEKARFRLMPIMALNLLVAGCAPTYAPHIDAPATQCRSTEKLAPLDPRPELPDAEQAPCPPGSGLAACFTLDQDVVRQRRFKILHDDRDYCRDAYDRARGRAGE